MPADGAHACGLLATPFTSARDAVWKTSGALTTYAATTQAGFQIVPRNYDGGFLRVDDATCNRCHENAGRPFRDYYGNILAYGEYIYLEEPLIQAQFDRLIPTSYPTITVHFSELRATTWPLIYPGVPQVHITENLIHPTDQALLGVN